MNRYYCWRIGGAVNASEHDVCPECGSHPISKYHHSLRWNQCGKWVQIPGARQGTCCESDIGHDGECETPETLTAKLDANT